MLQYVTRRAVQSVAIIIIAALCLHTVLMVYLPDKMYRDQMTQYGFSMAGPAPVTRGPWPVPFLIWLFDPNNNTTTNDVGDTVPKGLDLTIGNLRIKGSGVLTGDFGQSTMIGQGLPVTNIIADRWLNTVILVLAALIPAILIAVPLGVLAAARKGSRIDHAVTLSSFLGLSMPPYWLGLMLVLFFAVIAKNLHDVNHWDWLPYLPPGNVAAAGDEGNVLSRAYHLILPAMALALAEIAVISRHVRTAMLEVLNQDYVRTAWAKGLPSRRVLFKHAFRNAMIPVITTIALAVPVVVAGTIVIETVFNYPGMGQLFFQSMGGSLHVALIQAPGNIDYNMVMTLMLTMVVVVVGANFVADLLYAVLNPRMVFKN